MSVSGVKMVNSSIGALYSKARTGLVRSNLTSKEFVITATVFAAVTMNFFFAMVNAHVVGLTRNQIILGEILIVLVCVLACYRSFNKLMIPWIALVWMLGIIFLLMSLFRESIEAKYFRDVLIIPIFVALGLAFAKGNIVRLFAILQALVLGVMLVEGLFVDLFGELVNPLMYYLNTREWVKEESFWKTDSVLFISAWRPQDRFFSFVDIHRLSSVFLEPVSLGNWCVIITIFLMAMWRDLSRRMMIFFLVTNAMILVGSDGRFATVCCTIILLTIPIALRLPRYSQFLYLPAALFTTLLIVIFLDLSRGDDFLGRLGRSIEILSNMDLMGLLGLNEELIRRGADSGISYVILTQSILGFTLLWTAICFLQATNTRMGILCLHGICIYVALSLLISFSMFTVKTAAPLWFLYGYVCVRSHNLMRDQGAPPVAAAQTARALERGL